MFEATPSRLQRPSEPSFFFKPNTEACFCRQEEFLGSQLVERICKGRVINMTKKQIAALRRIIKREQSVYDIAAFNANKCRSDNKTIAPKQTGVHQIGRA